VKDILKTLNNEQRDAVLAGDGPVMVLAGAGSGKTRVLTMRIAHLISERKVPPQNILAVTFTKKAAGEMKERIKALVPQSEGLWIGTFHSIFSRILRREASAIGYTSDFVIYDREDQEKIIKTIINDTLTGGEKYSVSAILSTISKAKNSLVPPEIFSERASTLFEEMVAKIYPLYQIRLRKNNGFDFDDLITVPILLFTKREDILKSYQERFRYILVDEYQDTNRAQYQLIRLLGQAHLNICVVGDDDQSIYRWRGADIRNILEFEKDFSGSAVYRLEQNYRSTKNILKGAVSVVANNKGRKGKTLWSENDQGEKIDVVETRNEHEEARSVVEKIHNEIFKRKRTFNDFAILFRTNAQSRVLEDALRRSGISYVIVGGIRFYERKEVKDLLAYLKLVVNPKDDVSFRRVVNFPYRGIGKVSLGKLEEFAKEKDISLLEASAMAEEINSISDRIKTGIKAFYDLISKYMALRDKFKPDELVHALTDETGMLLMYKKDISQESQSRAENIHELLSSVDEYVMRNESSTISGFLEEVSLVNDIDSWDSKANAITLMTLHSAKGLEFPVVMITGCEEGLFPLVRSIEDTDALEEERRLFYVGLTRAKQKVYIFWANERRRFNEFKVSVQSRFLDEIDSDVVEIRGINPKRFRSGFKQTGTRPALKKGFNSSSDAETFSQEPSRLQRDTRVSHKLFGEGRVIESGGKGTHQTVTVLFDEGTKKKFLVEYANLTVLG